ncbi:MAG: response regulator [Ktedonobacteraceae bacterium]
MTTIEKSASSDQRTSVKTILIVEDDEGIRTFLQQAIEQETRYHVCVVSTCQRALEVMQQVKPDLLLLDYYLHPTTGIALYDLLQSLDGAANIPTIIVTASLVQYQQEIEQRHLFGMSKPFDLDELLKTIENILA